MKKCPDCNRGMMTMFNRKTVRINWDCPYCKAEWMPVCDHCLSTECWHGRSPCPKAEPKKIIDARIQKMSQAAEISIPHDGTGAINE